jgi:hypothetical protein
MTLPLRRLSLREDSKSAGQSDEAVDTWPSKETASFAEYSCHGDALSVAAR